MNSKILLAITLSVLMMGSAAAMADSQPNSVGQPQYQLGHYSFNATGGVVSNLSVNFEDQSSKIVNSMHISGSNKSSTTSGLNPMMGEDMNLKYISNATFDLCHKAASYPTLSAASQGLFRLSPSRKGSHRTSPKRHPEESHFTGSRLFLFPEPPFPGYLLAQIGLYRGEGTFLTLSSVSCPRAFPATVCVTVYNSFYFCEMSPIRKMPSLAVSPRNLV